jgi:hypothetical protein
MRRPRTARNAAGGEAAGAAEIAHDGEGHGGFAAAGFADETERLARLDGEAEAGDDIGLAGAQEERDARRLEGEDGGRPFGRAGVSHVGRSP